MSIGAGDPAVTAPIAIQRGRPSWREVVALFRMRNFRYFEISMFSSSIAFWMSRVAIDWLMLELTGNLALVGLAVTLQFGPTLLFGALAGVVADRFPRRSIVLLTQSVSATLMSCLAVLAILGAAEVWHVYTAVVIVGTAGALEGPARGAIVGQLVEPVRLRTAVSINASVFHIGGLIGPALSGILIGFVGSGWSIGASVIGTLVSLLAFSLFRTRELSPVIRPAKGSGGLRVAVRYAIAKPTILWPIVLIFFVAAFGMTLPVLFTAAASDGGFDTGSAGYGLYTSLAAVGAVTGAVASARRGSVRLRSIAVLTGAYGLAIVVAGIVPLYAVFLTGIVAMGVFRLLFATGAESMVQLSTNPTLRGRVLAVYSTVLMSGQAVGGILIGWIAEVFGMVPAFTIAGGVPLIASIVVAIILARRHQLTIKVNLRDIRRVVQIVRRPRGQAAGLSSSVPSQRSEQSTSSAP